MRSRISQLALASACVAALSGCQTWTEGETLPSGHYVEHPPQYILPSPQVTLRRELSAEVAPPAPPDAAASKELEEALREHAEALAALKVATRALEASQKRLEALANKANAAPPASPPATSPTAPGGK